MAWSSAAPTCDEPSDQSGIVSESIPNLETLFEMLERPLLLYALKLTQDRSIAEDLVQEAFCRICPLWSEIQNPRPWLFRTVYNLAMTHHRNSKKWTTAPVCAGDNSNPNDAEGAPDWLDRVEEDPGSPFHSGRRSQPDQALEREEAFELTRISLETLDPRSREALRLKYEENYSYKAIGDSLGIKATHVGYILHHALKTLAIELQRMGVQSFIHHS